MKTALEKLKAIGILFLMIFACIGVVWVTNQLRGSSQSVSGNQRVKQIPVVSEEIKIEDVSFDTLQPIKVEQFDFEEEVEDEGSGNQCKAATNIDSYSICLRKDPGEVNFKEGERGGDSRVSVNSQVILYHVTVPLELFSGVEVKDSNRRITNETPTLKAAGEQIDERNANFLLPPGSQINKKNPWIEEEPFTTKYSMSFDGNTDTPTDEGELGVDKKLTNVCEHCNNASNVNPDKTNKISEFILDTVYRTPGQKKTVTEEDVVEMCDENKDRFVHWESTYEGCFLSAPAATIAFFKTIGDALWNECLAGDESKCIDPETIILIMSSPFGSEMECIDGVCTNAFMNKRNNTSLAPAATNSGKFYYTTPCKAIIQAKIHDITCAWDMSHLFKERKVNEFGNFPTLESTPSDEEYNRFLLEQIRGTRGIDQPL